MNCVELFVTHSRQHPRKMALWLPASGSTTFDELESLARRAQKLCRQHEVGPGDAVLLWDGLNPRLYGSIIGILGLGASVILVEPWMTVAKIDHVIRIVKPKLFLSALLGKLWGLRVPAIRAIPHWASTGAVASQTAGASLHVESVEEHTPGIITFTSGTTRHPKGVARNQGYLVHQHRILSKTLGGERANGPDLCIFTNFALLNLASGRGTLVIPPAWKASILRRLDQLPKSLMPESLTCGPAFLERLMDNTRLPSLQHIHVGGALTDCWIFEKGFQHWPHADWVHLYGSSEAEPVAVADAPTAVRLSRQRQYFQTLYLGHPVADIQHQLDADSVWVAGPHVCPQYVGNAEENRLYKRQDQQGKVWHFMGDRVTSNVHGWWYGGRSGQRPEDFQLEQRIYQHLQSSCSFVQRDVGDRVFVLGEKIKSQAATIRRQFPEVEGVVELKIMRDGRHRARIDRVSAVNKGAKWLLG